MNLTRDDIVFRAKIAEQANRHDDMVADITTVAKMDQELTWEERYMLAVAYINVINPRRESCKILTTIMKENEQKGASSDEREFLQRYKEKVEEELQNICDECMKLIDVHLICKSHPPDAEAFYFNMKGDLYRYMAEFLSGDRWTDAVTKGAESYKTAVERCSALDPVNPDRLGVVLNYSMFLYYTMNDRKTAFFFAQDMYCSALMQEEKPLHQPYDKSPSILRLIRDNLYLWVSENEDEDGFLRFEWLFCMGIM